MQIIRVPPSMTGPKYRKAMGISEHWMGVKKGFRVQAKFRGIKVEQRIPYLMKMVKVVRKGINIDQVKQQRGAFDSHKFESLPIADKQLCYACLKNQACLRHHVITLANGGRNKRNNIVPLCKPCHEKVHPHLRRTGPKVLKKLCAAVASQNCVMPKNNGLVAVNPQGNIVSVAAVKRVTASA